MKVEGGGGDVVLEGGLGEAEVAGVADAGDVGGLSHQALDACAGGVAFLPVAGFLLGAGGGDGFVDLAGAGGEAASLAGRPGALAADGAFPAGFRGERDGDDVRSLVRAGFPALAVAVPWGQVACCLSQSMVKAAAVRPPSRASSGSGSSGVSRVIPCARAVMRRSALA